MKIASSSPERNGGKNSNSAKSIYRFLQNERFSYTTLLTPLYEKTKEDLANEDIIYAVIDLSSWEKPYSRKMEELSKVQKKDKNGQVNGYMVATVFCVGGSGKKGIGYFHLFSHKEIESQNTQINKAIAHVQELLPGKAQIIWIWDRGFDDRKNYKNVSGRGGKFVGRIYQNRNITVNRKTRKLLDWIKPASPKTQIETEIFVRGKKRKVKVWLSWGRFHLDGELSWFLKSEIVYTEGIDIDKVPQEDRTWYLITNLSIKNERRAMKVWRTYYKRWIIEDFFKFLKEGLGAEEFQVLKLGSIRKAVAMVVVAGAFIYELGPTTKIPFVRILLHLGGWTEQKGDKPGKIVLMRGLAQLFNYLVTHQFLEEYEKHKEEWDDKLMKIEW